MYYTVLINRAEGFPTLLNARACTNGVFDMTTRTISYLIGAHH